MTLLTILVLLDDCDCDGELFCSLPLQIIPIAMIIGPVIWGIIEGGIARYKDTGSIL